MQLIKALKDLGTSINEYFEERSLTKRVIAESKAAIRKADAEMEQVRKQHEDRLVEIAEQQRQRQAAHEAHMTKLEEDRLALLQKIAQREEALAKMERGEISAHECAQLLAA